MVLEPVPGEHVFNSNGTVHAGFVASLLDSACGYASVSRLPARQAVATLEIKVAFHKAIAHGTGTVVAEGRVLTMGRRVAFVEATLKDREGALYATATSTLLVTTTTGHRPVD